MFAGPKPGLSTDAFQSYWVNFHAVDFAAKIPQIRRYLVATRVACGGAREVPFFQGIAEMWLGNDEEQFATLQTPEFLQGARQDAPRWAAFWATFVHDADGEIVKDAPYRKNGYCKLYVLLKRRGDLSLAQFEVALIKPSGRFYDIEFIQRLRIQGDHIIMWKSCWDSSKGNVAFRGDMSARLIAAAKSGDLNEAMRLLPFGANANAVDPIGGQPALMLAAARGHLPFVQKLLEFGADPNGPDRLAGTVPLHKAAQGNHKEVVKALLAAGAFVDFQAATTGHTPLVEAIWYKAEQVVAYLLSVNCRLGLLTTYGFSVYDHIDYAIEVNEGRAGQAALLRIKELVAARRKADADNESAGVLNKAVLAKDLGAVPAALAAGQDIEQRYPMLSGFSDGHTPLLLASRDGLTDIVQALIAAGANVNATDPIFGAVPLHKATYHGYGEIVKSLVVTPHVNLDYQGPANGYTPLHDALWHAYPACAQTLLEAGAHKDIYAYDGKLPVDIAIEELGAEAPMVAALRVGSPN